MAEEEELPEAPGFYTLVTAGGEEKKSSIAYSGKGQATYPNGDKYDGVYDNGIRNGAGSYTYRDTQDVFTGTFVNNVKTGMGRVNYKKGGFYQGSFQDGKRHGEGTFQYPNKDIYSGMWKDGKRHGKGTYVYQETKYELKGDWKDGKLIQGTWTFTDGTRYVGGFQNQKPCGDGIWEMSKGTIVEGAYVQQVVPLDDAEKKKDGVPPTDTRVFWKTATLVSKDD
mmetsp:Transcript_60034/g.105076  ORF Transcript_60034/g.105076 Transcript_60034/m.105076 type:complete len:224 (-) Transcript_60034:13-684(-)